MPQNVTWNGVTYPIPLAGELNWSSLSTFLIDLGTYAAVAQEAKQTIRVAVTSPVTVAAATDYAVITDLTVPGAVAVNLPAGIAGQIFIIVDGKGDALTNNITITPNGAETIAGSATLVLNKNRQSVFLGYDVGTTDWKLLEYAIPLGGVAAADISGVLGADHGGMGVANNVASTVTINGAYPLDLTLGASTSLTAPASGTLATLAGSEDLSNKTLTDDHIVTALSFDAQAPAKFFPPTGTDYIGVEAPDTLAGTTTFKLPAADGTIGQVVQTDGAGQLSFTSVGTVSLSEFNVAVGDVSNMQQPTNTLLLGAINASTKTATVTISNASPGLIAWASHGLIRGDTVYFTTTGSLPTGLSPSTRYYVVDTSTNNFSVALVAGDQGIDTSSAGSGVHTAYAGGLVIAAGVTRPYIVLDTGNGVSTATGNVRRFATLRQPSENFTEFTYSDTSLDGGTITINTPGVYQMEYCDRFDVGAGNIAITLNSTAAPQAGNSDTELAIGTIVAASCWDNITATAYLRAGDIVRCTVDTVGITYSTSTSVKLRLTKIL